MKADQIQGALKRKPFRPLVVRTGSGESFEIPHPEHGALSPSGRTLAVFLPDEFTALLDVESITEIVAAPSSPAKRGRSTRPAAE